jgi:hypothetical protein
MIANKNVALPQAKNKKTTKRSRDRPTAIGCELGSSRTAAVIVSGASTSVSNARCEGRAVRSARSSSGYRRAALPSSATKVSCGASTWRARKLAARAPDCLGLDHEARLVRSLQPEPHLPLLVVDRLDQPEAGPNRAGHRVALSLC